MQKREYQILRNCPFCGARGAIVDVTWEYELWEANKTGRKWWCVECFGCHARGPEEMTQGKAAEAWNRRTICS